MPLFIWIMNRAIALDYETSFVTIEVRDVISELMLPPEFKTNQLPISKKLPQQRFSRRLLLSKLARKIYQTRKLISATILPQATHPLP